LDTAKTALKQVDILKLRNSELENLLKKHGIESKKIENNLKSELEDTQKTLVNSSKLIEEMNTKIVNLKSDKEQFCELFSKFCT